MQRTNRGIMRPLSPIDPTTCWYCSRPGATGTAKLGGITNPGSKIRVCAAGTGCQDPRIIRHGLTAPAHRDDETCAGGLCTTGRATPRPSTTLNSSPALAPVATSRTRSSGQR